MKFFLITVMSAILITCNVDAQHVNIGIKGGVNLYNIPNDNNINYDMKVGLHVGLLAHIHIVKHFALQPEVVFSTQGAKYSVNNVESRLILNYVNVPLLFQFMFDNGFRLQAGPQVGFLINAKSKVGDANNDIKDNFKPVDFGAALGVSYVHPPTGFGVDARVNLGLNNINENGTVTATNRGVQLGVFYLFRHRS
jgi:hypothetical protein